MTRQLFSGDLTRLVAFDPDRGGELYAEWYGDSEFTRYYDFPPVRPRNLKRTQKRLREDRDALARHVARFHIQTLVDGLTIGECELERSPIPFDEAWVAIAIGNRAYWSRGYGSDALRQLLAFGFLEWNVHRITLAVFDYNPRAIRSYEKVGFKTEGRNRALVNRGGTRCDNVCMGILRSEWESLHHG